RRLQRPRPRLRPVPSTHVIRCTRKAPPILECTGRNGMSAVLPQDPFAGVRRRVLMLAACPFPAPRGTPVRILRIAESLAARGHEVHLATYHLGTSGGSLPFAVHRVPRVPTYRRMEPGPDYQKLAVMDPLLAGLTLRLA